MTRTRFALRRVATALVVAGIVAAQAAHAQVTLNFVNADIDQVAKAIGAATGKTIIVDPRVKGQLNLVAERPVPEDQALKTLQSALRMQGFALVQDHGVLKVVPEADAKLQGVPTYIGNAPQARGDQVVTQVFELRNESANNLLPVLRPLISPNNTITAYPANNTIVVTDYADNVRRIAQIIAGVDSAAGSQVAVVPLKNANAIDIAAQLTKLLDPGAIGNTDATLKVTVQADPRTNALLLRASNAQRLAAAKKIAQQLDAPSGVPGNMHVVPLRNAEAVKLAKTLRGMLGKGGGESGSSASSNDANAFNQGGSQSGSNFSTGASGTPPLPSGLSSNSSGGAGGTTGGGGLGNAGLLGGDKDKGDDNQPGGMIQADAASNSLIITASDPVYRNLRAVIDQLDARRAQVYIEALVVELQATTSANLGIQWQVANNALYAGTNLVTGQTGSGKTTTLYASMSRLETATTNIMTVEDPIEYDLSGIGQTQVNERIGMTFARALRSILRQDPDIIMIGEIRDLETAQIAVQASLTGHLVLATLHTNDAASAVTRLTDMGVEPYLLASSLLGVLAQRLVRQLCPACKEERHEGGRAVWHPVGCDKCGHSGYTGRRGVYELLVIDDSIRSLIHRNAADAEILATGRANGMRTLRDDAERWLAAGATSLEEVLRVTGGA